MYNPQLDTFIRVADAGSFNKAAEQAFITPTAVIKQINLLETELDVQLFVRTHRGLKLTEAGKSLCDTGKKCPEQAAQCHPYRLISHDTAAISGGALAENS